MMLKAFEITPTARRFAAFTIGSTYESRAPLVVMAGPCALESYGLGLEIGSVMRGLCSEMGFSYIFKASFDKANRTSVTSYRGPGIDKGLEQIARIGRELGVPVMTDIHEPWQAEMAAEYVDMLQIPAFLCRQTDLIAAAVRTGKPINIKKAQFLAPNDMRAVISKCRELSPDAHVSLCERGTTMGYHQLVVDMRSLAVMREFAPVVFDATHSVQNPGGLGAASGGDRRFVLPLARAATAVGIDGLFMETHPNPSNAKCDGPNMVPLARMRDLLTQVKEIDDASRAAGFSNLDFMDD